MFVTHLAELHVDASVGSKVDVQILGKYVKSFQIPRVNMVSRTMFISVLDMFFHDAAETEELIELLIFSNIIKKFSCHPL